MEYRRTGRRTEGLKALTAQDSMFNHLSESQRCALIQDIDLSDAAGMRYLKSLPIKRAMRRRLLSSKWIVNMCSGSEDHSDLKVLEDNGLVLLELDLCKSRAFNLRGPSPAYHALLWAAMRGQLEGLIGSPPRGEGEGELVLKQFLLWCLSRASAETIEARPPYFMMTMPVNSSLWTSPMWKGMRGPHTRFKWASMNAVRCATNLAVTLPGNEWEVSDLKGQLQWTKDFRQCLVQGINKWRNSVTLCRLDGPLSKMTKEELNKWTEHVRQEHVPYNKRCKTCVVSKATGHSHRRVPAPSCYTLSVDVCGPFRIKGSAPGALDYRYMLVGSYTMPVLKREKCEPGDVIINEPEGGIGDVVLDPGEDGPEPTEVPGLSGPREDGPEPTEVPGLSGPREDGPEPAEVPGLSGPREDGPEPAEVPGLSGPRDDGPEPAEVPGLSGPREDGSEPAEVPGPKGPLLDEPEQDMEGLFELEDEDVIPAVGDQDQEEMDSLNAQYNELVAEIGDTIDYQVLRYAVPMRSRRSAEVNARVRQMYLQVKADGLEVFRLHSDRATELCNRRLREWLLERGVLATTGEAQTPQQNGRAEATVKFVKSEARLLMTTAKVDKCSWPLAMMYAAARQRHRVLGKPEDLPCFGTPVHVRTKIYGQAGKYDVNNKWAQGVYVGPSEDIQHGHVVMFKDGTFVTSLHLKQDLVDADELVDLVPREAELPMPERRVRGKRRLAQFALDRPLTAEEEQAEIEAKRLIAKGDWSIDSVLGLYEYLKAIPTGSLTGRAATTKGRTWYTGMFVHGGVAGLRKTTTRLKWSTRFLVEAAKRITGYEDFTALGILEDMSNGCHKDSHNEEGSMNVVTLLKAPDCGGNLWLEDDQLEPKYAEWKQVAKKLWKKGFTHQLTVGQPISFQPRRWHEVQEWSGTRVTMVMFTPRLTKLHYQDKDTLEFMGFQSEFIQGIHNNGEKSNDHVIHNNGEKSNDNVIHNNGEKSNDNVIHNNGEKSNDNVIHNNGEKSNDNVIHSNGEKSNDYVIHNNGGHSHGQCDLFLVRALESPADETLDDALLMLTDSQNQLLEDLQERSERLRMMIEEEEILAEECRRAGEQVQDEVDNVRAYLEDMMDEVTHLKTTATRASSDTCLRAATVQEEPDYEKMLQELEGDLEVVHTVPLQQVRASLELWKEALEKEVSQLLGGTLRSIPLAKARELERQGLVKLVPSKGVFTLKPPQVKGRKVRRKFRLVLCGNQVDRDDEAFNLYASGVSADTVRLALSYAAHRRWFGGTSDVTGAFLLAHWPDHLARYAIYPPRVLIDAGLARADEAWEVLRPLYGLRESPAIWAKCRTDRLREAKIAYKGRVIVLKQSIADPEIWLAYDEDELQSQGSLLALIITYVDDLFYLSDKPIIEALHAWVQEAWPCSDLEWADSEAGTRYLGMEIRQRPDFAFELSQEGYIRDLLRSYGMEEALPTKLPCPREWLVDGDGSEEENFTVEELRQGQRAVGEQLWLMMRCRPDLQYAVAHLASKVSKRPNRVVQTAKRLLAYLKTTVAMRMVIGNKQADNGWQQHDESPELIAWSDASFSPNGERSFGASVITVNGYPISWKASKQAFVTLSVMEAELLEASTATTLMENIGCLLDEMVGNHVPRRLRVDNASAVAMITGGPGSWRTRHLKVRSAKIREQVENNELQVEHVGGTVQLADLATKMHGKVRLWELLALWGFQGLPEEALKALQAKSLYLACLVWAMMIQPSTATVEPTSAKIQVAGMDELLIVTVLVCFTAVVVWELVKYAINWLMKACRESPKQRKLRKLREAARAAAEEEVDKAVLERSGEITPPPEPHPTARPWSTQTSSMKEPMYPTGATFEVMAHDAFYKTDSSRSRLHTNPQCHGLRNSGPVYKVEYCAYCSKK